jgi:hypothetical protein
VKTVKALCLKNWTPPVEIHECVLPQLKDKAEEGEEESRLANDNASYALRGAAGNSLLKHIKIKMNHLPVSIPLYPDRANTNSLRRFVTSDSY